MASGEIHVGDVGTAFRLRVRDEDDRIVDLNETVLRTILFRRPVSLDVVEKVGVFTNDGTDGLLQYVTESGFLSEPGHWKYQGYLVTPSGAWYTDIQKERVFPNLR